MKIEHTKTFFGTPETSTWETETHEGRIFYLTIEDGKVSAYYPENGAYVMRSVDDAEFAGAASALLFPTDLDYLYDEFPMQVIVETKGYPHYSVQRTVDTSYFYAPFAILRGDDAKAVANQMMSTSFDFNDQSDLREDVFRFRIHISNVQSLYSYAYEAWTGSAHENNLKKKGYPYDQTIRIEFFDGFHDAKDFDLPAHK